MYLVAAHFAVREAGNARLSSKQVLWRGGFHEQFDARLRAWSRKCGELSARRIFERDEFWGSKFWR
jgi:hypothetical protein